MEFRKVLALRGPNLWASFPVLEAWVDLGPYKDCSSDEQPGLNERLEAWLPSMIEHRCSEGVRGGFFERLRRGTYPAHILEHVTLELMSLAGSDCGYGRARETNEEGVYKVVIEYEEEAFARQAVKVGRELFLSALHDRPFDVPAEVETLRELLHDVRLGPSTGSIVKAAKERGIPIRRLSSGSLVQLGWGVNQRRILTAETDRTGAIAEGIAQDKELTRALLAPIGVPVPKGRSVADVEDALEASDEIGFPVVVKPQHGNQGRGVATNLKTADQVRAAYRGAHDESSDGSVIVEKYAPGDDYRVLVVGDQVVAAARREPAHVVGDGSRTVAQLVAAKNLDPRRGDGHATPLTRIRLDEIALAVLREQGLTPLSIPEMGRKVRIRLNANLSTGGTAEDVTDRVHPEVAARCVEAARMIGLDVAGIDVVVEDIGQPLEPQGGVIVEVNAGPGLRMHLEPSSGMSRPVPARRHHRLDVPGRARRAYPHRRDHRHQRQDHRHAVRRPPPAHLGQDGRNDLYEWDYTSMSGGSRVGRLLRPRFRDLGADEPGWSRPPCWRPPAAASSAPGWRSTSATWPSSPTSARATTSA